MEASMRTFRHLLAALLVVALGVPSTAWAQTRHAVDPSAIAAALAARVAEDDGHRAAIREALTRSEVRAMAVKAGIDVDRLVLGLGTLSGRSLEQAAKAARQVNQSADAPAGTPLVGGASTIVISTTTVILALLLILLIVIAIN